MNNELAHISYTYVKSEEILSNPNKYLDDTLASLLSSTAASPMPREMIFSNQGIILEFRDAHIILQKLKKDGYADVVRPQDKEWDLFYITLEGAMLLNDGGYATLSKISANEKNTETFKSWLLAFGTWTAGVGTTLLVAIEILKRWNWILSIELMTYLSVFLFGLIAGMIIYMIILEALSPKTAS